jgi:hypothetical protein
MRLGDVLLVRDGNRMSLSPRAERLLPRVRLLIVTPLIEWLRIAAPGILTDIVGVAEDVAGDLAARDCDRSRPKPCRLALNSELRWRVAQKLALQWSPQQISGWLKQEFPTHQDMQISHEAATPTPWHADQPGLHDRPDCRRCA